ncbi:MAG: hypothetical protein IPI54_15350 [Chitinophagaceae bacterium]|nr:hypothetical protein [Chitinophagaceae bacterium]
MDIYLKLRIGLNVFEALACLAGFIYWAKIRNTYWKWFPVYLAIILITEVAGEITGYRLGWVQFNRNLYTFFCIRFQFLFFFWLFWIYFEKPIYKNWAFTGAIIYLLSFVINISFLFNIRFAFFSFSYMMGNIILLILTILFFRIFIKGNEILEYRSSSMFWICVGLLLFYLLSLPLYGLWNTLAVKYPVLFNRYWIITTILNYLMYLLFTLSFIWGKPK